ncbi:hypothetical protein [Mycolicibacterium fallax]|uniref:hypothetical protein n=1 Tax=Mycolicibacterium fallax TaxID=1793 RepID=UPI001055187B|nr:hypothetical protein [Mycolicibacterium fallax]BBY98363.1 hypothetical protein MFAL_18300 [Mycolicibacterium fallax]
MQKRVALDYERVLAYIGRAYEVSDAVSKTRIDNVLHGGAGACEGTALVNGLGKNAVDEYSDICRVTDGLDTYAANMKTAIDSIRRVSESRVPTAPAIDRDL